MNKRIRYIKKSGGGLMSAQILKAKDGKEYRAGLTADGTTGLVLDAEGASVLEQVNATSPHKTKIMLKQKLVAYGVEFESESRTKKEVVNEV